MNWGYFFLWVVAIFFLFLLTGWPVTPHLSDTWGNHYDAKNLTYYAVLYIHYLLGPLVFTFLGLGLFRNLIWTHTSSPRQLIFLLAYSVLLASIAAVYLTHQYAPPDNTMVETSKELSAAPTGLEDMTMNVTAANDGV
ncbi:expressed unknown protein [Seminavis robusta]|uniref:Uncharacterized protein n=1 Tax=Seminavis robusta TaxID=568900 RepID=A0A9N8HMV1_9STRA|nr:expressed unknown protein [Seminavis robusta]|eukprot:Sro932_g221630.1 n/a (138) ;mRNA; f:19410-19823